MGELSVEFTQQVEHLAAPTWQHYTHALRRLNIMLAVLATVLTLLGVAHSALLPSPAALPQPRQLADRILIANTLSDYERRGPERLAKQLDFYVAACEAGFEVHVVIMTLRADWGPVMHLFAPTR